MFTEIWELEDHIEQIAADERLACAIKYAELIKDIDDLTCILDLLNKDDRLAFATIKSDIVTSAEDLSYVLDLLNDEHKLRFAQTKLGLIKNTDDFIRVYGKLDKKNQPQFLQMLSSSAVFTWSLQDLDKLKKEDRLSFAMMRPVRDFHELSLVLDCGLDCEDAFVFVNHNVHALEDGFSLAYVLEFLEEDKRLTFAGAHQDVIKKDGLLYSVITCLDKQDRSAFAMDYPYPLPNIAMLAVVLPSIDEDKRATFARRHAGVIKDAASVEPILSDLDSSKDRFAFAMEFAGVIKSTDSLKLILPWLDEKDRLEFVMKHIEVISHGDNLKEAVFSQLRSEDHLAFANAYFARNRDLILLASISACLCDADQLTFVGEHADMIENASILVLILDGLLSSNRLTFARQQSHVIRCKAELEMVAGLLGVNKSAFIGEYQYTPRASNPVQPLSVLSSSPHGLFSTQEHKHEDEKKYDLRPRSAMQRK